MICITGSNGKTTTTSLIYHIFKSAGLNVGLAGNIGNSLALQVAMEKHDYYVIELSSFQLDNMYKFRANIAVLMNITPDHLDRYDHCMQKYVDAKFRITQNQVPRKTLLFTGTTTPSSAESWKSTGCKSPSLIPFAAVKEDGAIAYVEDGEVEINEPIAFNMEQEELALRGTHNLYNSLAAGICEPCRYPQRRYPQSLVRLQRCRAPSGKGSDRTRRPIHQRFQSNQCQFLLVRPTKHDNQNRAYPRRQKTRKRLYRNRGFGTHQMLRAGLPGTAQ